MMESKWVTINELRPGDVISTSRYVNRIVKSTCEGYIICFYGGYINDTIHKGEKVFLRNHIDVSSWK